MTLDLRAGTRWPGALAQMRAAPDTLADRTLGDLAPLLAAAVDAAASAPAPAPALAGLRARLARRVERSARAAALMHTVRHRAAESDATDAADGTVRRHLLHRADAAALRPGQPRLTELVELAPGAHVDVPAGDGMRSWFVLGGEVSLDRAGDDDAAALTLAAHDHLRARAVAATLRAGPDGALILRRDTGAGPDGRAELQRSAEASWSDFAPGVRRRVMWQQGGEAAMLYATAPGATVPRHGHARDEECLMLAGELFLDEVLLRPLDYQLAPAGTEHGGVFTDTGVLLYAHGDLELDLIAG